MRSGKNVVTPVGWIYPFAADRVLAVDADRPIVAAALDAGVTLHGTGIHPGGITERFPLMVSGLCSDVRHVRAEEFSDIRSYATEFVVREIMMFGKTPEETATSSMGRLMGEHFGQSITMLADELGWELDDERATDHQWALATAPIDSPGRRHRARNRGGATLHLDGHGRRPARHHGRRQLADGGGAPRSRRGRSAMASVSRSSSKPRRR